MGVPDSDEPLRLLAERLPILSDPTRLTILRALMGGELTVSEIGDRCGRDRARVSQHLRLLSLAGVLDRRKDGNQVFYRIAAPGVAGLDRLACESSAETAKAGRTARR